MKNIKKILVFFLLFCGMSLLAGTTGTIFETGWNKLVEFADDQYLGYVVGFFMLLKGAIVEYKTGETGQALKWGAGAGLFGGLSAMAESTAGALMTGETDAFKMFVLGLLG